MPFWGIDAGFFPSIPHDFPVTTTVFDIHVSLNGLFLTRLCKEIEKEGDYLSEYSSSLKKGDFIEFVSRLKDHQYGSCSHGLVLLSAYLNPKQKPSHFRNLIWSKKYDIEHILPKKWNNYDGWTNDSWDHWLDTLGNRIPLPKIINIAAKNSFFDQKKLKYRELTKESPEFTIRDSLDLIKVKEWIPEEVARKQEEKLKRLFDWIGSIVKNKKV